MASRVTEAIVNIVSSGGTRQAKQGNATNAFISCPALFSPFPAQQRCTLLTESCVIYVTQPSSLAQQSDRDVQAFFCRRRHQPIRPSPAKIKPGKAGRDNDQN